MNKYKVIIIDDERLAREEVKRHLKQFSEFEIVGEADNANAAKKLIEVKMPDVIFLDIQMPGKSGFDLLNELNIVPEVIFTTAYSEYAVKAFEVNAIDYLVKPIREERFFKCIQKVKEEYKKNEVTPEKFSIQNKLFIKDGENCYFFPLIDVRHIESIGNYARFHFKENKAMLKKSLNSIEEKLDSSVFFRINRSQIINIHYIKDIYPHFKDRLKIVLNTDETFEVSSRQSARFKNWNSL